MTKRGSFGVGGLVAPDPDRGRIFYATAAQGSCTISQYSMLDYSLERQFRVPNVNGRIANFLVWDADGLALRTDQGQLFLIRASLANTDLTIYHSEWPARAQAGQSFGVTLTVTDLSSSAAPSTIVTNLLPAFTTCVDAAASRGTLVVRGQEVVWSVGDLAARTSESLALTLRPENTAGIFLTNTAMVTSTSPASEVIQNAAMATVLAKPDMDHDGIPDDYEVANGLNPSNPADAHQDLDGDGFDNLEENLAGASASDPDSVLEVVDMEEEGSSIILTIKTVASRSYNVEYSDSWPALRWVKLASNLPGTNGFIRVADTHGGQQAERFYRVVVLPP